MEGAAYCTTDSLSDFHIFHLGSLVACANKFIPILFLHRFSFLSLPLPLLSPQAYANQERRSKALEKEVKQLRFECRKRRKMIEIQQNCIFEGKDPSSFEKVNARLRKMKADLIDRKTRDNS